MAAAAGKVSSLLEIANLRTITAKTKNSFHKAEDSVSAT